MACDPRGGPPLRDVMSTDYVGALLELGRERAKAERLPVTFQEADAEAFRRDGRFDVVLSTFGVMFTPDQRKPQRARRVCRPAAESDWPTGRRELHRPVFKTIGKYIPPAPGMKSPAVWGNKAHLDTLFGAKAAVTATPRHFAFRYKSPSIGSRFSAAYYGRS